MTKLMWCQKPNWNCKFSPTEKSMDEEISHGIPHNLTTECPKHFICKRRKIVTQTSSRSTFCPPKDQGGNLKVTTCTLPKTDCSDLWLALLVGQLTWFSSAGSPCTSSHTGCSNLSGPGRTFSSHLNSSTSFLTSPTPAFCCSYSVADFEYPVHKNKNRSNNPFNFNQTLRKVHRLLTIFMGDRKGGTTWWVIICFFSHLLVPWFQKSLYWLSKRKPLYP